MNKYIREILQQNPAGQLESDAIQLGETPANLKNVGFLAEDILTQIQSGFKHQPGTSYSLGSIVWQEKTGNWFESTINNNANALGATGWSPLAKISQYVQVFIYQPGVYAFRSPVVLHQVNGQWGLYRLDSNTRPFKSTNFTNELASGHWVQLGSNIAVDNNFNNPSLNPISSEAVNNRFDAVETAIIDIDDLTAQLNTAIDTANTQLLDLENRVGNFGADQQGNPVYAGLRLLTPDTTGPASVSGNSLNFGNTPNYASLSGGSNVTYSLTNLSVGTKKLLLSGAGKKNFTADEVIGLDMGIGERVAYITHAYGKTSVLIQNPAQVDSNVIYLANHETQYGSEANPLSSISVVSNNAQIGTAFELYFNGTWTNPAGWERLGDSKSVADGILNRIIAKVETISPLKVVYAVSNEVINSGGTTLTDEEIRDALGRLTGNDRLDASAIKNLPEAFDLETALSDFQSYTDVIIRHLSEHYKVQFYTDSFNIADRGDSSYLRFERITRYREVERVVITTTETYPTVTEKLLWEDTSDFSLYERQREANGIKDVITWIGYNSQGVEQYRRTLNFHELYEGSDGKLTYKGEAIGGAPAPTFQVRTESIADTDGNENTPRAYSLTLNADKFILNINTNCLITLSGGVEDKAYTVVLNQPDEGLKNIEFSNLRGSNNVFSIAPNGKDILRIRFTEGLYVLENQTVVE